MTTYENFWVSEPERREWIPAESVPLAFKYDGGFLREISVSRNTKTGERAVNLYELLRPGVRGAWTLTTILGTTGKYVGSPKIYPSRRHAELDVEAEEWRRDNPNHSGY